MFLNKKLFLISLAPILVISLITVNVMFILSPNTPKSPSPRFASPLPSSAVRLLPQNQKEEVKELEPNGSPNQIANREIIGYVPYWLIDKQDSIPYQNLTQIAYFGLAVSENGNFVKIQEDETLEPGAAKLDSEDFRQMKQKARQAKVKLLLTLRLMLNEKIEKLLTNKTAQQNLIKNTTFILKTYEFDGVNIDFEYEGSPEENTIKSFTNFAKTLTEKVHQEIPQSTVNVAAYADSAYKVRLTEIWPLSQVADHIIIMAYDFYRPSTPTAGPVSPLTGAGEKYEYDITQTIKDYLRLAPAQKIILGLPFYGYDWPVADQKPYSHAIDFAALSSIERTKKLLTEKKLKENWDTHSQTPYINYQDEEGINRQIFYENEKSLGLKLNLVNMKGLAGIAIWALGYEGNSPELWQTISSKLK